MTVSRYRLTYGKSGDLRFLGHLDTARLWQRTLRRAALPLAYTEGFHPRPKLSLGPPLSLGFTSRTELLDLTLADALEPGDIRARLAPVASPGLDLLDVSPLTAETPKLSTIDTLHYTAILPPDAAPAEADALSARAAAMLAADTLVVTRTRRGREKSFDVRTSLRALRVHAAPLRVEMTLAITQGGTANPREVLALLGGWDAATIREAHIERCSLTFASSHKQGTQGDTTPNSSTNTNHDTPPDGAEGR